MRTWTNHLEDRRGSCQRVKKILLRGFQRPIAVFVSSALARRKLALTIPPYKPPSPAVPGKSPSHLATHAVLLCLLRYDESPLGTVVADDSLRISGSGKLISVGSRGLWRVLRLKTSDRGPVCPNPREHHEDAGGNILQ